MGREFSSSDAKALAGRYSVINGSLKNIKKLKNVYAGGIRAAADNYKNLEIIKHLEKISIEELAGETKGLRIKNLKAAGYQNAAQIFSAPSASLDAVEGIGPESVRTLKNITGELFRITAADTKIRLSVDNMSDGAEYFLKAVYRYKFYLSQEKELEWLINFAEQNFTAAVNDMLPSENGFRWLFASSGKKEKAVYAYNYLSDNLDGDYGKRADFLIKSFQNIKNIPLQFVIGDFAAFSVQYINIAEKFCPGLLGSTDETGGLPEDIAEAIKKEPLHLEGLRCTLRKYQETGVKYILHQKRVLLGDEMGLGKTVEAIAAMVSLYNEGRTHFAVICPASVLTNWCREVKKFCPVYVTEIHGWDKGDELDGWLKKGGIAVTTYETSKLSLCRPNSK